MRKFVYIVFLLSGTLVFSQENSLENTTKDLYLTSDWQGLIDLSKKIKNDHFNTYETEYRLAVAYYYTGNYFDSASQFEHVLDKYHVKSDILLEFLYYSYLFSGRQQDAMLVAKDFPFHEQVKTGVKEFKFIENISAEGGLKLSSSGSKDPGIENLTYLNAGLGQQLSYRLKLQHAYTNISQNYIDFNYKQNEYYGNIHFQISKGLTLIPSYHYVKTTKDELPYNTGSTYSGKNNHYNTPASEESGISNEIKTSIFHLSVKKQWNRFFISPNIVYITTQNKDIGDYTKLQYGINTGITIKPTHDRLWIGGGLDFLNTETENVTIWNIKAYYSIGTKAYLYLRYLSADTSDFVLEDAMYYYNAVSTMKNNFNTTFGYRFSTKFLWYINYQYENARDTDYNISFTYNTIITGIKFDL